MHKRILIGLSLICLAYPAMASVNGHTGIYMLPMTCAELLPDIQPFLNFFEAVGRGNVGTERAFARRIFRILSLREKMVEIADRAREQNPVDLLIRKTLCFYREQREPLKAVTYDDPGFLQFLRGALPELENKTKDAIFQWEFDRQQRREYELQLEKNQSIVDSVRQQADVDADRLYDKIASSAKRKAKIQ